MLEGSQFSEGDRVLLTGQPARPCLVVRSRRRSPRIFRFYPSGRLNGTYRVTSVSWGAASITPDE